MNGEHTIREEYPQKVYAGVLGKIIGVYFGRPVEGWSYEHIRERFRRIDHYVNAELKMPLHVPDDDLSGTFTFLRVLEDFEGNLLPKSYGETWLNYVIEKKTIFWWGGFGRSTEHTAFLRLKEGHSSPESGSMSLNGQTIAEQIGAQIFMDGFALVCPDDPYMAMRLVKDAASVSHDGIAVESACFLAAMESLAFSIKDLDELIRHVTEMGWTPRLLEIVENVMTACKEKVNWVDMRQWLEDNYSYRHFSGNCHVIPNFALILTSLILGGNSFRDAMEIVVSSGWDTDCNAANVGCINGIRLGLNGINAEYDYRGPIADRFYCISSLGGDCVTDAVLQAKRIVSLHNILYKDEKMESEKEKRFSFDYPGSVQGFTQCPILQKKLVIIKNMNEYQDENGLILYSDNEDMSISTLTHWDESDRYGGYTLLGSPTLYGGQTILYCVKALTGEVKVRPYVVAYDTQDEQRIWFGPILSVLEVKVGEWTVPEDAGFGIVRVGLQMLYTKKPSKALFKWMDWKGAPTQIRLKGVLREEEYGQPKRIFYAFTSSADEFSVDKQYTLVMSHCGENGIADVGTRDWSNYQISAKIIPSIHREIGIVARTRGHRNYYAVILEDGKQISLLCVKNGERKKLKAAAFSYKLDEEVELTLACNGNKLNVLNGKTLVLSALDDTFKYGGAGFYVNCGTFLIKELSIRAIE